ncbi:hypothetical protein [Sphingopyxis sp. Root1497]|uniref:hypothetical protein n=1 Tax=Sphingopyxis sp. Root1497 TaxID=1736474 RepID=UPI0012E3EE91|nr:hypothetical protein [Sphingopyxis sp. Root1497]
MKMNPLFLIVIALATAGCGRRAIEVDHPFYLMFIEHPQDVALFRCPNEPGVGCAIDGLPGPFVAEAGANKRYIVVAQTPSSDGEGPTSYYYFERVPEETSGWGKNPERIVGPLDEREFTAAKAHLGLPEFTVRP